MARWSRWIWSVGTLAGLVVAGIWGCDRNSPSDARADVVASQPASAPTSAAVPENVPENLYWAPVRTENLRQYTTAVGSFRASQSTQMGSQVSGRLDKVLVDVGTQVRAGDPLAEMDRTFFDIEVRQLEAGVAQAKAALEVAEVSLRMSEREMQRQVDIFNREAASMKERDDAVDAHARAVAARGEARARLDGTERQLEYARQRLLETVVRAPYDAVVTKRLLDPGESVATVPPTYLLELQDVGTLYLEFSLPQELFGLIQAGSEVEYEVQGAAAAALKGSGRIATVFPVVDDATRSFRCRVVVDNRDIRFRPGLLASVRVVRSETADALVIPRSALRQNATGYMVMVSDQGRPRERQVQVGLLTQDRVHILTGLSAGDQVQVPTPQSLVAVP